MDAFGTLLLTILAALLALHVPRIVYSIAALRGMGTSLEGGGRLRISVIVPARQEPIELIRGLLVNLAGQKCRPYEVIIVWDWPATGYERVAREAWRFEKSGLRVRVVAKPWRGRGKASVLNYALRLVDGDAVLVVDVDDRLCSPEVLCALERLLSEHSVVQLGIRGVAPLHPLQRPTAVAIHAGFRVVHLGRESLGLPVLLVGSGLAARRGLLEKLGGFNEESIVEDVELAIRCFLAGHRPVILPDSLCMSGAPGYRAFRRQQARWSRGVGAIASRYYRRLLGRGLQGLELIYTLSSYALDPLTLITAAAYAAYAMLAGGPLLPLYAYTIVSLLEALLAGLHASGAPVKNRVRAGATAAAMGVVLGPVLLVNWLRGVARREGVFEVTPRRVSGRERPGRLETLYSLSIGSVGLLASLKLGLLASFPILAPLLAILYLHVRLPMIAERRA